MSTRFILILIALMWSAYATAGKVVNEPQQDTQWLSTATSISAKNNQDKPLSTHQSNGTAKNNQQSKSKRSQLGGMFDILLPSGLRDN